ncbi:hypothetical protein Dxin01_00206 [Deinococcus xinjiangensis]|uniref:Uncharacterized protein n=1 Tax=Deinococcus xinjiangensis TaxID=457454 RepID=A0ABP9V7J0_9DEIO
MQEIIQLSSAISAHVSEVSSWKRSSERVAPSFYFHNPRTGKTLEYKKSDFTRENVETALSRGWQAIIIERKAHMLLGDTVITGFIQFFASRDDAAAADCVLEEATNEELSAWLHSLKLPQIG